MVCSQNYWKSITRFWKVSFGVERDLAILPERWIQAINEEPHMPQKGAYTLSYRYWKSPDDF
jgi:hypothetical protein